MPEFRYHYREEGHAFCLSDAADMPGFVEVYHDDDWKKGVIDVVHFDLAALKWLVEVAGPQMIDAMTPNPPSEEDVSDDHPF